MRRRSLAGAAIGVVLAALALGSSVVAAAPSFVTFESGPVRPLALSPDGTRLFATNIPDGRLEIFETLPVAPYLRLQASVVVGLEPVAVAARNDGEVWVVNHLSDSVSIVDVSLDPPRVVRTLLVGDEPRDLVFAGPGRNRAFITTAHRGQHRTHVSLQSVAGAGDPQLATPGVGRADVWVFDAEQLGATLGGTPLRIVVLFGDTPRALATSPDGGTVYAAVFRSGNQTTAVSEAVVCDGFNPVAPCSHQGVAYPGGNPGPAVNHQGAQAPEVGLIVKRNAATGHWEDELGRNWDNAVRFNLPDRDVFAIDAATLAQTASYSGVGTILFNMVVNPANGNLYVTNLEAFNEVRFEGSGDFGGSTVQGHLAEARVTVVSGAGAAPRHLNKHIDYDLRPAPPGTSQHSLATPLEMAIDSLGTTLYIAAFGSSKIGVFHTASLESDSFDPETASAGYIPVTGGGPAGLALDESAERLYVLTRFDNSIAIVDVAAGAQVHRVPLHNPEPPHVVAGRRFLYDATASSSNGEASCASCHIFGDLDDLAWDLGDPDGDVTSNPIPIKLEAAAAIDSGAPINGTDEVDVFHPMKGPMTTQTLRGLRTAGAMHWRGDRSNGFFGAGAFDATLSFANFIVAFPGLLGRAQLPAIDNMLAFTRFALDLTLPPNPVRALDNSLTPAQSEGRAFFLGQRGPDSGGGHRADGIPFLDGVGFTCEGCHRLAPAAGHFGTDGQASFESETQIVKIPHLRNLYQKVGMFGMPPTDLILAGDHAHQGDQVRGFGFLHDGSVDTVFRFLRAGVFDNLNFIVTNAVGFPSGAAGDTRRREVEQFLLAFDSDLAPIVGQQITIDGANAATVVDRLFLLVLRALAPFPSQILGPGATECDLMATGVVDGEPRGYLFFGLYENDLVFVDDRLQIVLSGQLGALFGPPGQALTFTCAPPGSGLRMALDRDGDFSLNGLEIAAGADPANAGSRPGACQDGLDNDGDGLIDLADGGCDAPSSNIENPQCDDGLDNDADGFTDADGGGSGPGDPQCAGQPAGPSE